MASGSRFRVIQLPRCGGAGPIAWRQLIGAVRSSRALLILLLIIGIAAGTFIVQHRGGSLSSLEKLLGAVVWMNMVFISMLKFDFRDELDRLDLLRSLPIRPIAVAAAELFTPVLVLTAMQATLLVVVALCFKDGWKVAMLAAAFAVPFNVLFVGIENLLFLMFPLRSAGLIAGDMQLFGRQMVIFPCKFLLLLAALTIAAAVGTDRLYPGQQILAGFRRRGMGRSVARGIGHRSRFWRAPIRGSIRASTRRPETSRDVHQPLAPSDDRQAVGGCVMLTRLTLLACVRPPR